MVQTFLDLSRARCFSWCWLSQAEQEATMRCCLALKDSGYSLAADTDLAGCPGVLSLWLPWCLKYAFALTQCEFDTSVSKLHPKSPERLSSGRELTVYKLSQQFHIFCVSSLLLLLLQFLLLIIIWFSTVFSFSSGEAPEMVMSVQLLDGLQEIFYICSCCSFLRAFFTSTSYFSSVFLFSTHWVKGHQKTQLIRVIFSVIN